MVTFLKYFGMFCLMVIAASLALCSYGVYRGVQTANMLFVGAENYTCRQYTYDLENPQADKLAAMAIAAVAYGYNEVSETEPKAFEEDKGIEPAVRKVYELCKGNPDQRVITLFAASITGQGANVSVATSPSIIPSSTTPQNGQ